MSETLWDKMIKCNTQIPTIYVKEKIQNVQRRIEKEINKIKKGYGKDSHKDWDKLIKIKDKIFQEEIGDKLLEKKQ